MSSEINDIKFLGKGWSFPPRFDKVHSKLYISTGDTDIRESLAILLGTSPGERFLYPKYGCDLSDLAFESLTITLKGDLIKNTFVTSSMGVSYKVKLEKVI